MKNYDVSRLKRRVAFGTVKTVENDNIGDYDTEFVPEFTVWCGDYTQTMMQQYTLLGEDIKAVKSIAIRHNDKVNDSIQAQLDGVVYNVTAVNSDSDINAFDVVTLQKNSKSKV